MDVLAAFDFFGHANHLIETGGYVVLFGLLFACGLGLPLPEDIPLVIAGALIAQGKMHWAIAGLAAWCGIIGGDLMLYHFGQKFGRGITRVPFVGKHINEKRLDQVEALFEKYGVGVVAIGRLFAGVRGAMVVVAGTIRFNFFKFLIADGIAALFSGGLFMLLGHWIGSKLTDPDTQEKIHRFKTHFFVAAIAVAAAFVAFLIWRARRPSSHAPAVVEESPRAAAPPAPPGTNGDGHHAHAPTISQEAGRLDR